MEYLLPKKIIIIEQLAPVYKGIFVYRRCWLINHHHLLCQHLDAYQTMYDLSSFILISIEFTFKYRPTSHTMYNPIRVEEFSSILVSFVGPSPCWVLTKNKTKRKAILLSQFGRTKMQYCENLIFVTKRTGILLYRENLNKDKIYTRRIYNTDRKIITEGREEWMMRFQMIEIDHIYRKEIYCANSAADPTSFIFSTKTAPPPIFDFRNTPPWGPVSLSALA